MSAALLASLFTSIAATTVFAGVTVVSAGSVPRDGTSTGTVTYTLTENSATALDATDFVAGDADMVITLTTVGVTFSGTAVLTAPGSLGADITVGTNTIAIDLDGFDPLNVETITISGLTLTATAGAALGAITNTLTDTNGTASTAFLAGTVTATGVLQSIQDAGNTSSTIAITSTCPFAVTGGLNGNATFSDVADSRAVTVAPAPVAGIQIVTFAAGLNSHPIGTTVSQTVDVLGCPAAAALASPGTVVDSLVYNEPVIVNVFSGENNQLVTNLTASERTIGFLSTDTVVTFTISTAGVTFSGPPTITSNVAGLTFSGGVGGTLTATGVLTSAVAGAGAGTSTITTTSTCPFAVTGGLNGNITFSDVADPRAVTAVPAGSVTYGAGTVGHLVGVTVSQTVANCIAVGGVTLSADQKSASAKVTAPSTALGAPSFTLSNIRYDVASTVTSGTKVNVTLSLSGGKVVTPTSRANAQVGRIFNATAATLPPVNIGQNGQTAGLITIVEVTAGAFTDGTGGNNVFEICLDGTATFTSPGPSAFVTGGVAAGNLRLREGDVVSPDNIVAGTADPAAPGCYYWTVFTKSTTASTITIGSTATVGPLVNVNAGTAAGPLNATLSSGTLGSTVPLIARSMVPQVSLAIANRVFPGQVSVTAVSQPIIAPGATHALAGDILIQETGNGQLKSGSTICVDIVPNAQTNVIQDVYFSSLTTADLPIATATGGVVIGAISFSTTNCVPATVSVGTLFHSFRFVVSQQSTTGIGKVTISNIHYNVVNDAALGPVQVNVYGFGVGGTLVDFQRVISNARIGVPAPGTAATRLGVTQVGAFTISTKIAKRTKYVTYRIDFGVAAAGRAVQIWGATKTGNDWSAFTVVTTRTANASGVVYYYIRQNAATWRSYRGFWVTGGAFTPARQARWIP